MSDDENEKNEKGRPGLSTSEMLWILLAIAAVLLISRLVRDVL